MVSAADYKGWALGLLVEALAAGVTGSTNSLDVKGLKVAEGAPHNLGQFYLLIDPSAHQGDYVEKWSRVAKAVEAEEAVRIPGAKRRHYDPVNVPDALWQSVLTLAGE